MNEAERLFARLDKMLDRRFAPIKKYRYASGCIKETRRFYPNVYAHGGYYWWNPERLEHPGFKEYCPFDFTPLKGLYKHHKVYKR